MLTFQEIAPYLPYKLNFMVPLDKGAIERVREMTGLTTDNYPAEINLPYFVRFGTTNGDYQFMTKSCSPILHPLSDLTKPCLPDGKIPIMELAEIAGIDCDNYFVLIGGIRTPDYQFEYNNTEASFLLYSYEDEMEKCRVPNQLKLFQKIYQWHFWLGDQNRFGQDIIDINTLEK